MHILISITSHTIRDIISILMAILFASLNTSMVDWQVDFLFSFDLFYFLFFLLNSIMIWLKHFKREFDGPNNKEFTS